MKRLAIITSHPIQYHAPWFAHLTKRGGLSLKVFYLWDFGVTEQVDYGFKQVVKWDVSLLDGYDSEFVPNVSPDPGTHHFRGLQNPTLLRRVADYRPDAVLLFGYKYQSLIKFLWCWRQRDVPLIFRGDSHRLFLRDGVKDQFKRKLLSLMFTRFSAFLYVGHANQHYFRYHGVPTQKLFFSPHAVDNSRFSGSLPQASATAAKWKSDLGIRDDHAVILFAGKFEEKKRPVDLLHAFVRANLNRVSLLFVGAGTLECELKRLAASHHHIYFAPFQNQSQMPRTYALADLVVLPSYGADETWGLAINESMCMSRPVIASTSVGCAWDLVHSYKNGLVFPAGDVTALTDCLVEAFSDRERLRDWGQASSQIIKAYSYEETTRGLVQALSYLGIVPGDA